MRHNYYKERCCHRVQITQLYLAQAANDIGCKCKKMVCVVKGKKPSTLEK